MYLQTTQRRNKDGSVVRYYALAENVRHPGKRKSTAGGDVRFGTHSILHGCYKA